MWAGLVCIWHSNDKRICDSQIVKKNEPKIDIVQFGYFATGANSEGGRQTSWSRPWNSVIPIWWSWHHLIYFHNWNSIYFFISIWCSNVDLFNAEHLDDKYLKVLIYSNSKDYSVSTLISIYSKNNKIQTREVISCLSQFNENWSNLSRHQKNEYR